MYRSEKPLVLGSGSPRRREFLERLGLELIIVPPDVDEASEPSEEPRAYLERVVDAKLAAVARASEATRSSAIVVADTSVVVGNRILQKPGSDEEGEEMVRLLRGTTHEVMTRYAIRASGDRVIARTIASVVTFRAIEEGEIFAYVRSGEGRDKAGGYAIQGLGAAFVERIDGSHSTIVGLPVSELVIDLLALGVIEVFG